MAIKKDSILAWAKALKIDPAKVEAAITATDEVELPVDDSLIVLTKTEHETFGRNKYGEGKKAGEGMTIDDMFKEEGIEVSGKKDAATFREALKAKVLKDANISVDEKVKEKDGVISKLRENIKAIETQVAERDRAAKAAQFDAQLLSDTIDMKPDHFPNHVWTAMLKAGNQFEEVDGTIVVKRDGKIVQDEKTVTPVPVKDALRGWITETKIGKVAEEAKPQPGRGAGDSKVTPGAISNRTQFQAHLEKQGLNPNGQPAAALLQQVMQDNPNFDPNS